MSDSHLSDLRFDSLALQDSVQAGIHDAGFEFCTPIQASTLPIALEPRDVAGQAQTGTGKTAAFLVATFEKLLASTPDPKRKKQPPEKLRQIAEKKNLRLARIVRNVKNAKPMLQRKNVRKTRQPKNVKRICGCRECVSSRSRTVKIWQKNNRTSWNKFANSVMKQPANAS